MQTFGLSAADQAALNKLNAKRELGALAAVERISGMLTGATVDDLKRAGEVITDPATLNALRSIINVLTHEAPKLAEAAAAASAAKG